MGRSIHIAYLLCVILLSAVILGGCHGETEGPPDDKTPPVENTEFIGSLYFSGTLLGESGTFKYNLKTRETTLLSSATGLYMQTTGATNAILLLDAQNQATILRPSDGQIIPLVATTNAYLAPNGRKYFYHDLETNTLYESHVDAVGGRSFAADGRYGAHSPDLQKVAYLNTLGLVLTDADNLSPVQVDFTGLVKPDETFLVPETGDYFPRWSPDGNRVAASVSVADSAGVFSRGLAVVVNREGVLKFYLANTPTEPTWSADGKQLYYVSSNTIYVWDFETEKNTYIDGGSNTVNGKLRTNQKGDYLGFVRTGADGASGAQVYDSTAGVSTIIVPLTQNGVLSLDWPRQAYCAVGENAKPVLSKVEVLVDGVVQDDPVVAPPSVAVLRLHVTDADCNLEHGVSLVHTGDNILRPVSLNLAADTGCSSATTDLPAPVLEPGEYDLTLTVEDICGAVSEPATFKLTVLEAVGDDDDDNDDNDDNDNDNDDNDNDDTTPGD